MAGEPEKFTANRFTSTYQLISIHDEHDKSPRNVVLLREIWMALKATAAFINGIHSWYINLIHEWTRIDCGSSCKIQLSRARLWAQNYRIHKKLVVFQEQPLEALHFGYFISFLYFIYSAECTVGSPANAWKSSCRSSIISFRFIPISPD